MGRGGVQANFTSKFLGTTDCVGLFKKYPASWTNPFRKVLILTDGSCGSSCDTATRTAYMTAMQDPTTVSVSYISYGGLGGTAAEAKQTLSATSFPGGNVNDHALAMVWKPLLQTTFLGILLMQWAGFLNISSAIASFGMNLPEWPYWGNTELPGFAQSEIYQKVLGKDSLPMEYYFIPTDIYLPTWYDNVGGQYVANWNESELLRAYTDASAAFAMMPDPTVGFRSSELWIGMPKWKFGLIIGFLIFLACLLLCCCCVLIYVAVNPSKRAVAAQYVDVDEDSAEYDVEESME